MQLYSSHFNQGQTAPSISAISSYEILHLLIYWARHLLPHVSMVNYCTHTHRSSFIRPKQKNFLFLIHCLQWFSATHSTESAIINTSCGMRYTKLHDSLASPNSILQLKGRQRETMQSCPCTKALDICHSDLWFISMQGHMLYFYYHLLQ